MVLQAFKEIFAPTSPISLLDIKGFPYEAYNQQLSVYEEAEKWFTGAALAEQPTSQSDVDLYPMRINPIVATVLKHAHILFGDARSDGRPLVNPKLVYDRKTTGQKDQAHEAEEALLTVWDENHASALLIESSLIDQIYGGSVFKASYAPWEWDKYGGRRSIPIRIEHVNPKNFVGIPEAGDPYSLVEAWIVQEMLRAEAVLWGYNGTEEKVWYIEHWTQNRIEILIDGQPAYRLVNGESFEMSQSNLWGFIPMVYIPHLRAGSFLGFNCYSHLVGMVKELNARWGDYGDAVNDDSHPVIAAKQIQTSVQEKKVNNWFKYMDLGTNVGISGNEPEPDMFQVNEPRASAAMKDLVDGIFVQFERDASVPPVGWGEDEGSQRSGATLEIRFWPLTSYAQMQRYFWSQGLNVFDRMLLNMMKSKTLAGMTDAHTKMRIKQIWAPFLPKDRTADVNEWSIRSSNNIASVDHLIDMAGDVEDIEEEKQKIVDWITQLEEAKASVANKYAMQQQEAQAETQMEMQDTQLENQQTLADKSAETAKEVAKSRPAPTSKPAPQRGGKK